MKQINRVSIIKFLRPVLTAIMYAIAALIVGVTVEITIGRSDKTWIIIIISIVLSISTNMIWSQSGVEKAEKTKKVYNTSMRYHTYANYIMMNQLLSELREFCIWRNNEFEKELLIYKMGEYLLKYSDLTKYIELKQKALKTAILKPNGDVLEYKDEEFLGFISQFNKKQKKALDYYSEHKIKFRPLVSDDLTEMHKVKSRLKPMNREFQKRGFRYVGKILWGVGLGILSVGAYFYLKEDFGRNEIIQLLVWLFCLLLNVFTSWNSGYKSVSINRYEYIKEKNERCAEFFKYANVDIQKIEEGLQNKLIKEDLK